MDYVAQFLAGAFICNGVPHLVCGLQGSPFPTPFAKPHGVGMSSPLINFAWGLFNLVVGAVLLSNWPTRVGLNVSFLISIGRNCYGGVFVCPLRQSSPWWS